MTASLSILLAQGSRFVCQRGSFMWEHPDNIDAGATDCTDMTADEFQEFHDSLYFGVPEPDGTEPAEYQGHRMEDE